MTPPVADPPALRTRGDVAELLGLPLKELTWWIWGLPKNRRYKRFEIARRSGGARVIDAPIKPIKDLQRNLADILAKSYRPPPHVHGFVPDRSPDSNAGVHQRQEWIFRVDLADFFPSIHFGRVHGMFQAYPFEYAEEVATLLAQLCCHDNHIPQGAPTSPVISNLICRGMDKALGSLAMDERTFFTRYADDLCFSTDRITFPASLGSRNSQGAKAGGEVDRIVREHGFRINTEKTNLVRRTQRQRVTGLVVNEKLNVARDYVRSLRDLLFIWEKYGEEDAAQAFARATPGRNWPPGKPAPEFRLVVRGRVQYVGQVKGWDNPVYRKLALALQRVDADFKPHSIPPAEEGTLKLFTEGTTDIAHVLAAQSYFHDRDGFLDIRLVADEGSALKSGSELLKYCEYASRANTEPSICLFDTDDQGTLKKATGGRPWKLWGKHVAAVALASPPFRGVEAEVCIELLYEDEILQRENSKGRRIYLREEFDERTGHHKTEPCTIPHANNRTLVQEDVHATGDHASIGMSKAGFAAAIESKEAPFEAVSFEGFRGTFEAIRDAARNLTRD